MGFTVTESFLQFCVGFKHTFEVMQRTTLNNMRSVLPSDAEKSITTARSSRQIQRLAERLIHIFTVSLDLSCKRPRYSGTDCPTRPSLMMNEPERCDLIYTAASHKKEEPLLPWAMLLRWKYPCCSHDQDRESHTCREGESFHHVHICSGCA